MTLKVEKVSDGRKTVIRLSGRLQSEHLDELKAQLEDDWRGSGLVLDGVTVFPGELYRAPQSWAERNYHKLIYFHEVEKGGRFGSWQQPELFAAEIRAAFRSLR